MRQHLDIDSLLVEYAQTLIAHDERSVLVDISREIRPFDDVDFFGNDEMTVNIDDLYAAVADHHFTALRGRCLKKHSGHYGCGGLAEIPPIGHG